MILRKYQLSPGKGFTLIELMIVMLIMAIMLSISLPAFRSMGRGSALRNSVSSVCNTLSMARQWAITHKENVTFEWKSPSDTNSYFYVLNEANKCLSPTNELPLEIEFDLSSNNNFTFKSDGAVGDCIQKKIILKDTKKASAKKTITINGLTGGIRVQ